MQQVSNQIFLYLRIIFKAWLTDFNGLVTRLFPAWLEAADNAVKERQADSQPFFSQHKPSELKTNKKKKVKNELFKHLQGTLC